MTDTAAVAPSKSQLAYAWIKSNIANGTFVSGYRLVLGSIARELDVSVVPVREAIRLLESEGLVTFERNVGAQVALLDEDEYVNTMQTLSIVEGAATALSAARIGPDEIARARDINERMKSTLEDFQPHHFTDLNLEFHSVLFECCPNPHLLDLVHRGWARLRVLRDSSFSFVPGRAAESVREHDEILDLLASGAPALDIELAARAHRTRTLDAVVAYQAAHRH
jgi:DNA-binding GntR family transcriptional regulator